MPSESPTPQIVDKRKAPPGVMPRQIQTWALVGITVLMIAVLMLSSPAPAPTRPPTNPALSTVDPSVSKIQEYQRRVDEQAQRLAAERAELELAKRALNSASGASQPQAQPAAPQTPATDRPMDLMQQERAQREVRSRFSDPIVLTTRSATASTIANSSTPRSKEDPAGRSEAGAAAARGSPPADAHQDRLTKYRLPEGTVIEAVLTNQLKGVFTGPVNAMVTTAVYSTDGQNVLIPPGSRLLGEARAVSTASETRLAVTFHRLEIPDRQPINLDRFQGLNQQGDAGLADEVNHHYFQTFGMSIALGALGGLAQANSRYGGDTSATDVYRQGVASSFAQSSTHILDRFLNLPADVTIRVGHLVRVYLSNDLELPAYVMPTDAAADTRRTS